MLKIDNLCKCGIADIKYIPFHVSKTLSIIHVISGTLEVKTVAGSFQIETGQTEIFNVKEPIMLTGLPNARILYLCFDNSYLETYDLDFECVTFNCNANNFFAAKASEEHITTLFALMVRCVRDIIEEESRTQIIDDVDAVLNHVIENFDDIGHLFDETGNIAFTKERFKRISEYMIAHVSERIGLNDIARQEYLSVPYLSKEFKEHLEQGYIRVMNYYRTINAVIQLLNTDNTLTYIAENSGFSSVRYYNKIFTEYLGCLPSKFRSMYTNKSWDVVECNLDIEEYEELLNNIWSKNDTKIVLKDDNKTRKFTCTGTTDLLTTVHIELPHAEYMRKVVVLVNDEVSRWGEDLITGLDDRDLICGSRKEMYILRPKESGINVAVKGEWQVDVFIINESRL